MASVRTFQLPHYNAYPVHVALFTQVRNSAFLKSQLLHANPDFDYAFLDADMILSSDHLLSTTFLALHAFLTDRHKTRTPHSELVFRLSPNNNIGESYKKFGLSDSTTNLIAVKLPLKPPHPDSKQQGATWGIDESVTNASVSKHLGDAVQGASVPMISTNASELGQWCNVEKVAKVYKLGSSDASPTTTNKKGARAPGSEDLAHYKKQIESVILGTIALKGS